MKGVFCLLEDLKEKKMELKERIKKEIDSIPEEYLVQLEEYVKILKNSIQKEKQVKTLHLHGKFDKINIRKLAYKYI